MFIVLDPVLDPSKLKDLPTVATTGTTMNFPYLYYLRVKGWSQSNYL